MTCAQDTQLVLRRLHFAYHDVSNVNNKSFNVQVFSNRLTKHCDAEQCSNGLKLNNVPQIVKKMVETGVICSQILAHC